MKTLATIATNIAAGSIVVVAFALCVACLLSGSPTP